MVRRLGLEALLAWALALAQAVMLAMLQVSASAWAAPPPQSAVEPPPQSQQSARIAIIMDDLGYQRDASLRTAALPGPVTLAVLPFTPHALSVARAGQASGKELMLHVPMEPHNQVPWEVGGLSSNLDRVELQLALLKMLEAVPNVAGINNHMGSKFTEDPLAMEWLVDELAQHQLYLIDSRTTAASHAWESAQAAGLPSLKRDIFLDNVREEAAIEAQLQKLIAIARRRGYAVAIGHPHPVTLDVLELYLPRLHELGVELVTTSRLLDAAGQTRGAMGSDAGPPATAAPSREVAPAL